MAKRAVNGLLLDWKVKAVWTSDASANAKEKKNVDPCALRHACSCARACFHWDESLLMLAFTCACFSSGNQA
jgi:hypothetical protein